MKFTIEEISLCKQVAERYKREVEYGIWFIWGDEAPTIASGNMKQRKDLIPLWTISDCLEFLREKGWLVRDLIEYEGEFGTTFLHQSVSEEKFINGDGKTPLEAFLKSVLAVLEEGE